MGSGQKCLPNDYPKIGNGTTHAIDELPEQGTTFLWGIMQILGLYI